MENNDLRIIEDTPVSELIHSVDDETSGLLEDDPPINQDELAHWGIKGMRWGVRRYQNKDGTLTTKGKKRYNKELAEVRKQEKIVKNRTAVKARLDKLAARKQAVEDAKRELDGDKKKISLFKKKDSDGQSEKQVQSKKKKLSDMSDEELSSTIRRLQMEQQYKSLTAIPDNKATVAKGDGFVKRFMKNSVEPAVVDAGKNLIRDKLMQIGKNKLGLSEKSTDKYLEDLGKEFKRLNLEKNVKKLKEEAKSAANKTANTPAAAQLKKDIEEFTSSVSQQKTSTVATPSNTASGKTFATSKLAQDSEWQAFKNKYSWGVESYAMDEVVD